MTTEELSIDEKKKIYKDLLHYKASDNFSSIVENAKKDAEKVMEAIKEELSSREEIKMEYSELTRLNFFAGFYAGIAEAIDDSDGGKVFKAELLKQVENALSHIYAKIEVGFDTAMYTKLDMLKTHRNVAITIDKKLEEIINEYMPPAQEESSDHPYED